MTQPTPNVTAADVERVVRRDFPADRFADVMAMLNEYGTEDWQREADRVRLAVLKLAAGSLSSCATRSRVPRPITGTCLGLPSIPATASE